MAFETIPNDLRVPGFFVEFRRRQNVNVNTQVAPTLIIAAMVTAGAGAGSATPEVAVRVDSPSQAASLFGPGSMAHRMVEVVKENDPLGELVVIPVADNGSGVPAVATLGVTGTATESGSVFLTVGGLDVIVGVANGDSAATVRAAIIAAITAKFPVTATEDGTDVTFTAKNDGTLGNSLKLALNRLGAVAGQRSPAGLSFTVGAFASGATDPVLTNAIAAMGDDGYDTIICPWAGSTELTAVATEVRSRWGWNRALYGHVFSAKDDTPANLITFGLTRNDPEVTVLGYDDSLSPAWDWAAAYGGAVGGALRERPNRSAGTLELKGIIPPSVTANGRPPVLTRNNILKAGIATAIVVNSRVVVESAVTTYRVDTFGNADASWRKTETRFLYARITREQKARLVAAFFEAPLGLDGRLYDEDEVVATPLAVRGLLVGIYREQAQRVWVDGSEASLAKFESELKVEPDDNDKDRLNIIHPPDLINHLSRIAMRTEVGV